MTIGAELRSLDSVSAKLSEIPQLSMEQLWALWDLYFDERPNHHHRTWLESRLAHKIQEHVFGGLKVSVRRKLESIGESGELPARSRSSSDRLLPGTILTRTYDDIEHRVIVHGMRDFEYQGQRFRSLTAIANRITGSHWSGPTFFGLKSKRSEP